MNENKSTILKRYKIISSCCVAAMVCATFGACSETEKPAVNNDVTAETEISTNEEQPSDFESATEEIPLPEFVISEAGVLTAYNGTNDIVTVPDDVVSIAADAFGTSPEVEKIKTIKLGKSVEEIDAQAFASLTALESVEVPEENTYFRFEDGVLLNNDNTLFICMPSFIKDNYDMFDIFLT